MAFGFPPKFSKFLPLENCNNNKVIAACIESLKGLGWEISSINGQTIIAFTGFSMKSYSEEIVIAIEEAGLKFTSKCTSSQLLDFGKNKKNYREFSSAFSQRLASLSDEESASLVFSYEDQYEGTSETLTYGNLSLKEIFIPNKKLLFTPILLWINILVFVAMCLSGVDILNPSLDALVAWGANYKPLTLGSGWWRVLSSCFVHIGVLHLLVNLYALIYIGIFVEPLIGKWRFILAYLVSGVIASIASLYWNTLVVAAGASGAIFGLYGLFLALLCTKLIDKKTRKALLTSILLFVAYNFVGGFKANVDAAAHFGGLAMGFIIGLTFYPALAKNDKKSSFAASFLITLFALIAGVMLLFYTKNDIPEFEENMQAFSYHESIAINVLQEEYSSDHQFSSDLQYVGIYNWQEALRAVRVSKNLEIPVGLLHRMDLLENYCIKRIELYTVIKKSVDEQSDKYDVLIEQLVSEIEQSMDEISATL